MVTTWVVSLQEEARNTTNCSHTGLTVVWVRDVTVLVRDFGLNLSTG